MGDVSLNFRHLRAFRAVIATGSLTQAAEALGISQPAVSKLISNLERTLGFPLFARGHGRVLPTAEARYFHEQADKVFAAIDQLGLVVSDIRDQKAGQLRIASLPGLSLSFLPSVVAGFVAERPRVTVSLQTRSSLKVREWIAAQQFDLGVAEEPVDGPGIESESLVLRCVCALPEGHRLSSREILGPHELAGEPQISLNHDHQTTIQIEQIFRDAGVRRRVGVESQLFAPACALVARGVGVAIVDPLTAVDFAGRGLVVRRFEPEVRFKLGLLYPAQRPRSRLLREFVARLHGELEAWLRWVPCAPS